MLTHQPSANSSVAPSLTCWMILQLNSAQAAPAAWLLEHFMIPIQDAGILSFSY